MQHPVPPESFRSRPDAARDGSLDRDLRLAWAHTREIPTLRRGSSLESMTLAVGVNHVVVHGSDNALCGTTVVWPAPFERPRWHAATSRTCPDCVTVLDARTDRMAGPDPVDQGRAR